MPRGVLLVGFIRFFSADLPIDVPNEGNGYFPGRRGKGGLITHGSVNNMSSELKLGLIGETSLKVTDQDTAARWKSGLVDAYSTPALVGLTENASVIAIEKYLNSDQTSVGVEVSVKHLAATPVGMLVKAKAELVEINGRRLKFKIEAWDEKEKVCEGWHSRAIVDRFRFVSRLTEKAKG